MTRVVVDTSVLAAVCFDEPDAESWSRRLEGTALFAPTLLKFELTSVAGKKCRTHLDQSQGILQALALALDDSQGITWLDPDPVDVALVATATGLTTYDATYLCLAGMLSADLVTRDAALASTLEPYAG